MKTRHYIFRSLTSPPTAIRTPAQTWASRKLDAILIELESEPRRWRARRLRLQKRLLEAAFVPACPGKRGRR